MKASLHAPGFAAIAAGLLLAGALLPIGGAQAEEPSVTLAVLGETHGTRTITRTLVAHAASLGATGCVCPGDFIYGDNGATPAGWRDMMKPFMGRMIPAQGNHDPWTDWGSIFPGGKRYFSTDVNGVQLISLNPEHSSLSRGSAQRVWLESTLAERDPSALKVVLLHRPWWLPDGARHPTSEFEAKAGTSAATMDGLMRAHGVDLVVAGHEKNYQHSLRDGVHYLVQGGTGPEWDKYALSYELPGALKRLTTPVGSVLRASPGAMTIESYDKNGARVESFTMKGASGATPAPAPTPAPSTPAAVTFASSGGNEWWAQVSLGGADAARVVAVEAIDADTPWTPLSKRSWGAWAGSLHVEPGHAVTYRATLDDGRVGTSCAFSHPDGACQAGAQVAFAPHGGNEWWAQARLGGADAARVAKVEARDDDAPWTALTLRAWGSWAGSFHVQPGHRVQYRATLDDGRVAESCAFAHPAGGCAAAAPPAYAAEFTNPRGNAWWIEVDARAPALAGVDARVDGGAWVALDKTGWGSWAKSLRAPAGSTVEFRARDAIGSSASSPAYAWPPR